MSFNAMMIRYFAVILCPLICIQFSYGNECSTNPCLHGGSCETRNESFHCYCADCYTGDTCETEYNMCIGDPCLNYGTCQTDLPSCSYICYCQELFFGDQCQYRNECNTNPCLNGGFCEAIDNTFYCHCPDCYTGETCEIEYNMCIGDPCLNYGSCQTDVASCSYICYCEEFFFGDRCQYNETPCLRRNGLSPCMNDGTCYVTGTNVYTDYECQCTGIYGGVNCSDIDVCSGKTCRNGGSCVLDGDDKTICRCTGNYVGEDCTILQNDLDDDSIYWSFDDILNGTFILGVPNTWSQIFGDALLVQSDIGFGHALHLNGNNQWVHLGDFSQECIGDISKCGGSFSLTMWIRVTPTISKKTQYVITNTEKYGEGFYFALTSEYSIFTVRFDTRVWKVTFRQSFDEWFHLYFLWKYDVGLLVHIDGNFVDDDPQGFEESTSILTNHAVGNVFIGRAKTGGHFFNGYVDEVRFYRGSGGLFFDIAENKDVIGKDNFHDLSYLTDTHVSYYQLEEWAYNNSWLMIDLEAHVYITHVVVMLQANNTDVAITVSEDYQPGSGNQCGQIVEINEQTVITVKCGPNLKGRYIFVTFSSLNLPIYTSLSEIGVMSNIHYAGCALMDLFDISFEEVSGQYTADQCRRMCKNLPGRAVAAVVRDECYCLADFPSDDKFSTHGCDALCIERSGYVCGDSNGYSLFNLSTVPSYFRLEGLAGASVDINKREVEVGELVTIEITCANTANISIFRSLLAIQDYHHQLVDLIELGTIESFPAYIYYRFQNKGSHDISVIIVHEFDRFYKSILVRVYTVVNELKSSNITVSAPPIELGEMTTFFIRVPSGSNATCYLYPGEAGTRLHISIGSNDSMITAQYKYNESSIYNANLTCANRKGTLVYSLFVSVLTALTHISMYYPPLVTYGSQYIISWEINSIAGTQTTLNYAINGEKTVERGQTCMNCSAITFNHLQYQCSGTYLFLLDATQAQIQRNFWIVSYVTIEEEISNLEVRMNTDIVAGAWYYYEARVSGGSNVIFIWNFGDDAINFIRISKKTVLTDILAYVYDSEGNYNIKVTAVNNGWLVSKDVLVRVKPQCLQAEVRISGEREYPRKFEKSKKIYLSSLVEFQCNKSEKVSIQWSAIDTRASRPFQIASSGLSDIMFMPNTFPYGSYKVTVEVSLNGVQDEANSDSVHLDIIPSELVVAISGGRSRSSGMNQNLYLNASGVTYDPDEVLERSVGIVFRWYCKRSNEDHYIVEGQTYSDIVIPIPVEGHPQSDGPGCFGTGAGRLDFDGAILHIPPGTLYPNRAYSFMVQAQKDNRSGSFNQTIQVLLDDPPDVEIRCIANCQLIKNPDSEFSLMAECVNCNFLEELISWQLTDVEGVPVPEFTSMVSTGVNSESLSFYPNVFKEGLRYRLKVIIQVADLSGFREIEFSVNRKPFGGSCKVSEAGGVSCPKKYVTDCSGWRDDGNEALLYEFRARPRGNQQGPWNIIYFGIEPRTPASYLPMGIEDYDYIVDISLRINDQYLSYAEVFLTIQVKKTSVGCDTIIERVEEELDNYLAVDNRIQATQTVLFMSSLLNEDAQLLKGDEDNPTASYDDEKSRAQLRTGLLDALRQTTDALKTTESIKQASDAIRAVTRQPREISEDSQMSAALVIGKIVNELPYKCVNSFPPQELYTVAENLFSSINSVLLSADPKRDSSEHSKNVSSYAVKTLENTTLSILSCTVPDRPSLNYTNAVTDVKLAKYRAAKLAGRDFNIRAANVSMPMVGASNQQSDLLSLRLVSATKNVHVWESGAQNLASPIISVDLLNNVNEVINVRHNEEPFVIGIEISRNMKPSPEEYTFVPEKDSELMYFSIDVTEPDSRVTVVIIPQKDSIGYTLYGKFGDRPTRLYHDFSGSVPRDLQAQFENVDSEVEQELRHSYSTESKIEMGICRIGVKPTDQTVLGNTKSTYRFSIMMFTSSCRFWDEALKQWHSAGCKVGPDSNSHFTRCLCNHLTSFASSFIVQINTIDFSSISISNIKESHLVLIVIILMLVLYVSLAIWMRRKDKEDSRKWKVHVMTDNDLYHSYIYKITVFTGMHPEAGTRSKVRFILGGEFGATNIRRLEPPEQALEFERGSEVSFLMAVKKGLGPLIYLDIWHDNSGGDFKASWLLQCVVVTDMQSDERTTFLCKNWLAVERGDGKVFRHLYTAQESSLQAFQLHFDTKVSVNMTDKNMWSSIFLRPTYSSFTRVQRLSSAAAYLFFSMLVNAMFYKNPSEVEGNATRIEIGPLTFTSYQISVSIASALMTYPIITLIIQIFRKTRSMDGVFDVNSLLKRYRRMKLKKTSNWAYIDFQIFEEEERRRQRNKNYQIILSEKKEEYRLPWWFIYIGWFLTFALIFLSCFFIISFSLYWGPKQSSEWLTADVSSFAESVFVLEPLQLVLIAALISYLLALRKRGANLTETNEVRTDKCNDLQVLDDEQTRQRGQSDETKDIHDIVTPEDALQPPSKDILKQSRTVLVKHQKMKRVTRELIGYLVVLTSVCVICSIEANTTSYYMYRSIRGASAADQFTEIKTSEDYWNWLDKEFIPGYFPDVDYRGMLLSRMQQRYASNGVSFRLGPARLRQLRVRSGQCTPPKQVVANNTAACEVKYSFANEDTRTYNGSWSPTSTNSPQKDSTTDSAWVYRSWSEIGGLTTWAMSGTHYAAGGYVKELGSSAGEARQVVEKLRSGWIDENTRAVFLEFHTFTPNVYLFSVGKYLAEFPNTGMVIPDAAVTVVSLYGQGQDKYTETVGVISHLIFLAATIWRIGWEYRKLRRLKREYFRSFWNSWHFTMLLASVVGIVMYIGRFVMTLRIIPDMRESKDDFTDFDLITRWCEMYLYLIGIVTFMAFIEIIHVLQFNRRMFLLGITLNRTASALTGFPIVFLILTMAFSQLLYLRYYELSGTRTFSSVFRKMALFILGSIRLRSYDMEFVSNADPFGMVVLFASWFSMCVCLSNQLTAVVTDAFAGAKDETDNMANEFDFVDYVIDLFHRLTKEKFKTKGPGTSEQPDVVDQLDERTKQLTDQTRRLAKTQLEIFASTDEMISRIIAEKRRKGRTVFPVNISWQSDDDVDINDALDGDEPFLMNSEVERKDSGIYFN
ncbi:polycystin family receptor for egg jelly-like isoform X2 [Ptychodera flava]|uniref:polycystin family receptor for egg jelly-like isoform X2 n=1 Tax=Ptychodera flava TaxID=63121 RepID=UPI003969E4B7